jgi:hypothetical protein
MTEQELLRKEHNERVRTGVYKELLGCTCVNCGATTDIEYHHIVPLCVGGTNNLTNIAPVCYRCHKAIHGEKDYREYAAKRAAKPRKSFDNEISMYVSCKIGKEALKNALEMPQKGKLSQNSYYKRYLKSHGIAKVINKMDDLIEDCDWPPEIGREIGYIFYANGEVRTIFYE